LLPPSSDNESFFARNISMSANGRCLLVSSNEEGGAVYVYDRKICEFCFSDPQKLVSLDPTSDFFGQAQSISPDGKVAIITESSLSARVFTRKFTTDKFTGADLIQPTDAEAFSVSGKKFELDFLAEISISKDGKFAVFGSPLTKIVADDAKIFTGAVLVYKRNFCAKKWLLIAVVNDQPDGVFASEIGCRVALTPDGLTLIAFSGQTDSAKLFTSVYTLNNGQNYIFSQFILPNPSQKPVFFRNMISISDNSCTLAIAYANTDEAKGQLEIFKRLSTAQNFESFQFLNGTTEGEKFGNSVKLSGDGKALFLSTNPQNPDTDILETLYYFASVKYFL
jgi:hypothetical protein